MEPVTRRGPLVDSYLVAPATIRPTEMKEGLVTRPGGRDLESQMSLKLVLSFEGHQPEVTLQEGTRGISTLASGSSPNLL